jgi:hypothetical protein
MRIFASDMAELVYSATSVKMKRLLRRAEHDVCFNIGTVPVQTVRELPWNAASAVEAHMLRDSPTTLYNTAESQRTK